MRTWEDPHPIHRPNVGLGVALLIVSLIVLGCIFLLQDTAGASPRWYCSTTTTQGEACIPDDTTVYVTTTADPTTTVPVTVSTPPFCNPSQGVQCVNVEPPPTTVAPTTTVAATTTTTAPPTTVAPPASVEAVTTVPAAPTTVPQTLPVTGGNSWWLVLFGVCLLGLGGLAVAWRRTA